MDREHVKGAADKVKGAIKDTAGKVTGDKKLQSEGKFDKAKGSAHNLAGDGSRCVEDGRRLIRTIIARQQPSRPVRRLFLCLSDSSITDFGWTWRPPQRNSQLRQATLPRVHYSNI
jgi:uncharacterized protein YjbJ (UPF0337 family)